LQKILANKPFQTLKNSNSSCNTPVLKDEEKTGKQKMLFTRSYHEARGMDLRTETALHLAKINQYSSSNSRHSTGFSSPRFDSNFSGASDGTLTPGITTPPRNRVDSNGVNLGFDCEYTTGYTTGASMTNSLNKGNRSAKKK